MLLRPFTKLRDYRQNRRVRRIVRDHVERPLPKPSEIYRETELLPRSVKRAHKLEIRRSYRYRRGVLPSNQRQILCEQVAKPLYAEAEQRARDAERYAREDAEYFAAADT